MEKKEEKVLEKEHEKKVEELKPLLNDPKELEKIKKSIKEEVEKDLKVEMTKKLDEVRKRTE